jgi:hypothetical protein
VKINAKGLELLASLDEPLVKLNKQLMRHMTRPELEELIRLLEKLRNRPQGGPRPDALAESRTTSRAQQTVEQTGD